MIYLDYTDAEAIKLLLKRTSNITIIYNNSYFRCVVVEDGVLTVPETDLTDPTEMRKLAEIINKVAGILEEID